MGVGDRSVAGFLSVAQAVVVAALVVGSAGCPNNEIQNTLPPGTRVELFDQVTAAKVDVLWVVDNSGSMVEEQANVARNFEAFFEFLRESKTDFHVAVTTTDTVNDAGALKGSPAVIDSNTPNPLQAFANNVKVGIEGNARESGLDGARLTFAKRPAGFLRDDAYLFVIFVTDEEDHSEPGTPRFFYRTFAALKGKGNEGMVKAGAIIGDVPNGCSSANGTANAGTRYKEVVDALGGRVGSICDEQFDVTLREMGVDAVGLRRKFALDKAPDLATAQINVKYDCNAHDAAFFGRICEKTSECIDGKVTCTVKSIYDKLPCDTSEDDLAAQCAAVDDVCDALENPHKRCTPKTQRPDGWSYEPATVSIVFRGDALPPKGAPIEVQYLPSAP